MRDRIASLFPLALLIGLAAVTFWINRLILGDNPRGLVRHDPDFVVDNFSIRSFDKEGKLRNIFTAEKMLHYPDDDSTEVSQPRVTYRQDQPVELSARAALVSQNGKQVDLIDDVRVVRRRGSGVDSMVATERMTVFPDEGRAFTHDPVSFSQGSTLITATGIEIDNKAGTALLHGRVTGTIYRDHKR
jgi:lipopolysaccharide export system protein LptC